MTALTKAEAIAYIQQKLGFRDDLDAAILLELRVQQDLLEQGQSLPWWLRVDGSLSAVAATDTIALPTGFIRLDEDIEPWMTDTTTGKRSAIKIVDWDQLLALTWDEDTQAVATGPVRAMAIRNTTFQLAPVPTENGTIYASWYAKDENLADIASNESNLWLTYAPLVLVGLAGLEVAADLQHDDAVEKFQRIYAGANSRMIADIELRKSRTYQVGGEA